MADQELISKAEELAKSSPHSSVSINNLTNNAKKFLGGARSNKPVISYLLDNELPNYIYPLQSMKSVTIYMEDTDEKRNLSPEPLNPVGWFVITDLRFLIIVNGETEDDVISIPLQDINKIKYKNEKIFSGSQIWIHTGEYIYSINYPKRAPEEAIHYIRNYDNKPDRDLEEQHYIISEETVIVCKECRQEVPDDARKCPHCGYYPGSGGKGWLWHGTALATSWSPIGMAMLAKGATDEARTRRGVAEKTTRLSDEPSDEQADSDDAIERIRRLKELNEEGTISDEEFEQKKSELLDDI